MIQVSYNDRLKILTAMEQAVDEDNSASCARPGIAVTLTP